MEALENEYTEVYGTGGGSVWVCQGLIKKALENRMEKVYYLLCYCSVAGTFKDTYLSPYSDPASKNYDSHSTVRLSSKCVPLSWNSRIGSSVS